MSNAYDMMAAWVEAEARNGSQHAAGANVMNETQDRFPTSRQRATSAAKVALDRVFIHDLVLDASIGIYQSELLRLQPVNISIDMDLDPIGATAPHHRDNIVCYDRITQGVKAIIDEGHIGLVEMLAERIAAFCLEQSRVAHVSVAVSKPEAIAEARSVGVFIVRNRNDAPDANYCR